jgi:peroxiredoxin
MTCGHKRLFASITLASLLACPCGGCPGPAVGQAVGADRSPRTIPAFRLKDTAGREVALADFHDRKAVVVVFIGTECPLVNLYVERLAELHREFARHGVQVLSINSNSQDSAEDVARHAAQRKLPFPVLTDPGQKVADLFGAEHTPEAFLLDCTGAIRYRGRIDDQYTVGGDRGRVTRHDLAEAIRDILAKRPVRLPRTPAPGCFIGRAAPAALQAKVTYARDIAPILRKHCQECHRPGQAAPFSLLTYKQARAWSDTIREVVEAGRMPPWGADPRHGEFANDRRLPEADRKALLAWIEQDCPKGDERDLPPPPPFADGWGIGKPDLVLCMKAAYRIPARAGKGGIPYQYFVLPTNFDRDVWVRAVEARPGNRAVVHHMVVYIGDPPGREREQTADRDILVGFVPGSRPAVYPSELGKRIPKGAKLVLEMHYTANGTEQTDLSSIALVFAKEPPRHEIRARFVVNRDFIIPPRATCHEASAATVFEQDTVVLSLTPHMHLRGKSFQFRAVYPGGRIEILLSVPRYDFNWQHTYLLKKPLLVPRGTRIDCVGCFDNSAANSNNPDPDQEVRWGEQSWDEMLLGVVGYFHPDEGPRADGGAESCKRPRDEREVAAKPARLISRSAVHPAAAARMSAWSGVDTQGIREGLTKVMWIGLVGVGIPAGLFALLGWWAYRKNGTNDGPGPETVEPASDATLALGFAVTFTLFAVFFLWALVAMG